MVIRLLGLLSEDEKLRSSLMRYPDKLIEFLSLTLHRGALLCTARLENPDKFECSSLEVQSLTTALSLMSYLVSLGLIQELNVQIRVNFSSF